MRGAGVAGSGGLWLLTGRCVEGEVCVREIVGITVSEGWHCEGRY
jgi:hypothetical protein